MNTPSGYGVKTGKNQTEFVGEIRACSGVVVHGRSHGHTLNHTSTHGYCHSCVHSWCCGRQDLCSWCDSKKVSIGCASASGATAEVGCAASEVECDGGASECVSRHSESCCCRHFPSQSTSCCYVCLLHCQHLQNTSTVSNFELI